MRLEFDEAKNVANIIKHRVSFQEAAHIFADPDRLEEIDDRRDYGETRINCLGIIPGQSICGRVYSVTYTRRGDTLRLISARKANVREQNRYFEAGGTASHI